MRYHTVLPVGTAAAARMAPTPIPSPSNVRKQRGSRQSGGGGGGGGAATPRSSGNALDSDDAAGAQRPTLL
jgi:hypothetical protein